MLLQQLLNGLAVDLNDAEEGHENSRFSSAQLLTYLNEGLCNAFTVKPTAFMQTKVIKLDTGSDQQACSCSILHEVLGQTDAEGTVTAPVPRRNSAVTYRWTKPGCAHAVTDGVFKLTGFNFDPLGNGSFTVTPPVPPNQAVYMKVRCANPPAPYSASDMGKEVEDCQTVNAAKQWVLFRALMVDDESATSMQAAQIHLNLFFSLLNMQFNKALAMQLGVPMGAVK